MTAFELKLSAMRRYKAIGNSMPVPVIRWIGQRMEFVDAVLWGRAA